MKKAEWNAVRKDDVLVHTRYGKCVVKDASMPSFGFVVHIDTTKGQALLRQDCGADIADLMVCLKRELNSLINKEAK